MAHKMVVHFVCEVTLEKTGDKFQCGVTINLPSHDILDNDDGFNTVMRYGEAKGLKKIATLQQGSVLDYDSRVVAFQIMP